LTVQFLGQGPAHELHRVMQVLARVLDIEGQKIVIDGNDPDNPPADPNAAPQVGPGRATVTFEVDPRRGGLQLDGVRDATIAAGQPLPSAPEVLAAGHATTSDNGHQDHAPQVRP